MINVYSKRASSRGRGCSRDVRSADGTLIWYHAGGVQRSALNGGDEGTWRRKVSVFAGHLRLPVSILLYPLSVILSVVFLWYSCCISIFDIGISIPLISLPGVVLMMVPVETTKGAHIVCERVFFALFSRLDVYKSGARRWEREVGTKHLQHPG